MNGNGTEVYGPRAKDALDFLRRFHPAGPWTLVAIRPDRRKGLVAKTFEAGDPEGLDAWLSKYQAPSLPTEERRNVYFHVNPLRSRDKKASASDVSALAWVHVDLDPEPGKDLAAEQARIADLLSGPPPQTMPGRPTVVLSSGGGVQAFWKIADPLEMDGSEDQYESAKMYNVTVQVAYGADPSVVNVDRVMRLPGTVNFPDEAKIKKGRKIAMARLIEFNDAAYPLESFAKAVEKKSKPTALRFMESATASVNLDKVARLASTDDLDAKANKTVPDWTKDIINSGYDPKDESENAARNLPKKYPSASEAMFAVVCELVRCMVSDEVIYGIITDPKFAVSRCVLDKPRAIERYAFRQIERARERAIAPELAEMNGKYAVIMNIDGDCKVMCKLRDPELDRDKISLQSFGAFHNAFSNREVFIGKKKVGRGHLKTEVDDMKPLGKWWTDHRLRRQYEQIVFSPGREVPHCYNLWQGFAVEPKKGDCQFFFDHMLENLCSGNREHFAYLKKWMARAVKHPDAHGEVAVVLRGKEGTGKGMWAREFGSLFGPHFMQVTHAKHLVGDFNAHLRDCVLLFADEAFYAGDKQHESVLKSLVTEPTMMQTKKHVDSATGRNYTKLIMASNSDWVVPAGPEARRYFVMDVGERHRGDHAYWGEFVARMRAPGAREALLYDLFDEDLSDFTVMNFPMTHALARQKLLSMGDKQEWWYTCLCEGRIRNKDQEWVCEIPKKDVLDAYLYYAKDVGENRRSNSSRLGVFLLDACPNMYPRLIRKAYGDRRVSCYEFPSLKVLQDHFDKNFGGPYVYSDPEPERDPLPNQGAYDVEDISEDQQEKIPF